MSALAQSERRGKGKAAFTLLEMMVSLTLLALITAALFAILNTSFTSMNESAINIRRTQHVEACIELLRGSFRKLPPSSWIKSLSDDEISQMRNLYRGESQEILREGHTYGPPLLISGVAQLFSWQMAEGTTLSLKQGNHIVQSQPNLPVPKAEAPEANHILVAVPQADGSITLYACSPSWAKPLPLLDNLGDIRWRFLPANASEWEVTWVNQRRPAQVELTVTLLERPDEPIRLRFWIAVTPTT